jgi:uncharacterized membrane protein YvbJ
MSKCVDCGGKFEIDDKYCPACGSPTVVEVPDESDLRRGTYEYPKADRRRFLLIMLVMMLLVGMIIIILFLSRLVSTQLEGLSGQLS